MAFRVLSLNLCVSHTTPRRARMLKIRQFIEHLDVDAVLFQEALQVCWPIYNSLRDLCPKDWWCYSKGYIGFPWFYSWRVGILSRYEMLSTASLGCEVPQEEWLDAFPYPGRKRAVAATVDVPGLGITNLVSLHLTSSPKTEADRVAQFRKLRDWLSCFVSKSDVIICGGDFNTSQHNPAFLNPAGTQNITGQSPDYICIAGARVAKGHPVLTDRVVSDHIGVVAEIEKG